MIPKVSRGSSFKKLMAYLSHDKAEDGQSRPDTAARVGFVHALNFHFDAAQNDPEIAASLMAYTWQSRDALKAAAGIKGGTSEAPPVWHASLSWGKGEKVDAAEKMRAVRDFLGHHGLALDKGYQTVIVEHTDTAHPHVHVVVNLVHPDTGKKADPKRDQQRSQEWARNYDKARGTILCHDREEKYAEIDRQRAASALEAEFRDAAKGRPSQPQRGDPGHEPKADRFGRDRSQARENPRRLPYHQWKVQQEAKRAAREADFQRTESMLANRYAAMRKAEIAAGARRDAEHAGLREERQEFRSAIYEKYRAALDAIYKPEPGPASAGPDLSALQQVNRHLDERRRAFEDRDRSLAGRLENARVLLQGGAGGKGRARGLFAIIRLAMNHEERRKLFEREQRQTFARMAPPRQPRPQARPTPKTPDTKQRQAAQVKAMRAAELAEHDRATRAAFASMQARHQFERKGEEATRAGFAEASKAAWAKFRADHAKEADASQAAPSKADQAEPGRAQKPDAANENKAAAPPDPAEILCDLTTQRSTFSRTDLERAAKEATGSAAEAKAAVQAVMASPELVTLAKDSRGRTRYTAADLQNIERDMAGDAAALHGRERHPVSREAQDRALNALPFALDRDQLAAFRHVTGGRDLANVIGVAGSGKSTMLGAARAAWEAEGYRVRGCALSGVAADGLQAGAGIEDSSTIHRLLYRLDRGDEKLTEKSVLVVDEAGMLGSRLMQRLTEHAAAASAKLVLVGDPEQLQAIEAGGAFRALVDRHGAARMTTVRRQREGWQQEATKELAGNAVAQALHRYEQAGMVHGHDTQGSARTALLKSWDMQRRTNPAEPQIILAYRRDDVRSLNAEARSIRRAAGELGPDQIIDTTQGKRIFATGDRVCFLKNDSRMAVRNGSLGTIEAIQGASMTVKLDNGQAVAFSSTDYGSVDHGYASTIHKSQGVTVPQAHVLASKQMDKHAAYVALTRHRDRVDVHWSSEEFGNRAAVSRAFGRRRVKDTGLDYDRDEPRAAAGFAKASAGETRKAEAGKIERPAERPADRFGRSRERGPRPPRAARPGAAQGGKAAAPAEMRAEAENPAKEAGPASEGDRAPPEAPEVTQRPLDGEANGTISPPVATDSAEAQRKASEQAEADRQALERLLARTDAEKAARDGDEQARQQQRAADPGRTRLPG